MPYPMQVIRTQDFIRLDAAGKIDFERSRKVLSDLAAACVERGVSCALLDVRDLRSDLTTTELYKLARSFHEMGFSHHHRLAILHRPERERAAILAEFAYDRGWDVRAFNNYEEAIEWFATPYPLEPTSAARPG
ncbi:MAG: hypothetical protein ACTHM6_18375 [Tepidisphaeraceae bacterium]